MKKYLSILLAAFCSALPLAGQDKAEMEVLYKLSFLRDTTSSTRTEVLMVLRLNKDKSIFYGQNSYTIDSLLSSDQSSVVQADILANGRSKYGRRVVTYNVLKDFKNRELDYTDKVGTENYRYQEKLPEIEWEITSEEKKIFDYNCQKAICNFRGRTYEAWFTVEIPVSDGPWKFYGLPGLILELYDTQKHYSFEFAGIYASDANISLIDQQYTRSSREKYLQAYKNFIKNPLAALAASGITVQSVNSSGRQSKANSTSNYAPMELY